MMHKMIDLYMMMAKLFKIMIQFLQGSNGLEEFMIIRSIK